MGDETSQTFQSCRLKRGLFTPKHIAPSQTRGRLARAHANVPMAAPKGAIQAESQRAAAAAQPLCSWRFFGSGAEITSPIQNTENRFAPPLPREPPRVTRFWPYKPSDRPYRLTALQVYIVSIDIMANDVASSPSGFSGARHFFRRMKSFARKLRFKMRHRGSKPIAYLRSRLWPFL